MSPSSSHPSWLPQDLSSFPVLMRKVKHRWIKTENKGEKWTKQNNIILSHYFILYSKVQPWGNFLFWFCSHIYTEFSQTNFIFIWLWLLYISLHGCFPVESPNYLIPEALSNPLLNLSFKGDIQNKFNLILEERVKNSEKNSENLMKIGWKIRKLWHFHISQIFTKHFWKHWICKWVSRWCHTLTTCHLFCT